MIQISQLKLPIDHSGEALESRIRQVLHCGDTPFSWQIRRRSLDARDKTDKKYVYTIDVTIKGEKKLLQRSRNPHLALISEKPYRFPACGSEALTKRPLIVGSGPAGLFCAWYLARAGFRPVVIERGERISERKKTVEQFWKDGILDPDSNVQFGEGGAGTFSDGKLNTQVKDPSGRNREVLTRFVQAGAPEEILYEQKPHLGTDALEKIVTNLREQIQQMGGSFEFSCQMTELIFDPDCSGGTRICGLRTADGRIISTDVCVLAIGHSARDTFMTLFGQGVPMQAKSFAVGVRIQHPQKMINQALYGEEENSLLGAAAYKLTHTCEGTDGKPGRGVYTFCMCPGGYVVNASSEPGLLCVNGMSLQARDSENANSAVIVTVTPEDYPEEGPLGGIAFQRELERKAWRAGNGHIPVQRFEDFCRNTPTTVWGHILPVNKGTSAPANVRAIFPEELNRSLEEGIHAFSRKIKGFDDPDALLSGVESRTSSPVRIPRDPQTLESAVRGLYPAGEGAGYAGGITSAAIDGLKIAETIASRYNFVMGSDPMYKV